MYTMRGGEDNIQCVTLRGTMATLTADRAFSPSYNDRGHVVYDPGHG